MDDDDCDLNMLFGLGPICENTKDKYAAMRTLRTIRDMIDVMIGKLGKEIIKERDENE